MLVKFDGTAIDLIGTLSPYGGIAEVSIDGGAPVDADFYGGAATSHKRRVWGVSGLVAGPHTIALTVTTRRNPASLGGMAYVDALDVSGTLAPGTDPLPADRYPHRLLGSLDHHELHVAFGRQLCGRHQRRGHGLAVRRHRSDLIGTLSSYGGISTVSVDGGAPADVDFYGPGTSHKRRVWGVSGLSQVPTPCA